ASPSSQSSHLTLPSPLLSLCFPTPPPPAPLPMARQARAPHAGGRAHGERAGGV
ncbi:unnamed protein product, partial [Closterium sp. NIES-53]